MAIYTTIDNPKIFQNSIIYTGNDGTRNITEADTFQADLVWLKKRASDNSTSHYWVDSVRGATKSLSSNADTLEATQSAGVTGFVENGFSLGGQSGYNNTGDTFVSWLWKAGSSVSGTTTGSGTGKAYSGSVNTDSGFSIIKYVGNGTAGHTIPHNLGAAPKMVICKSISENRGWPIQHSGLTSAAYAIFLSSTGAEANNPAGGGTNTWNSTAASSSVVTLGNNANNNSNNQTYIMYSFAPKQGYSSISTYVGNGNTDGQYIPLSFQPSWFVAKRITASGDPWVLIDNKRNTFNSLSNTLLPNNAEKENTGTDRANFLATGIKIKTSSDAWNGSGSTYIYMAFAEHPLVTGDSSIPGTAR